MDLGPIQLIAIAAGLGMLVGLQREYGSSPIAGIRTFTLITLLGAVAALLAGPFGGWMIGAGLVAVAALLLAANWARWSKGDQDYGLTTEIAALVMYGVGALLVAGFTTVGIVLSGVVLVVLHYKPQLHGLVKEFAETDLRALTQLALIALIILPVLPDETYGPYGVLNPFRIWLMVVLIVGISLAAYVAYRAMGANVGSLLGGVLGGLISSTATTVSFARQTVRNPAAAPIAALVVMIASTIVFARVLVEIAAVAPGFARIAAPPLIAMASLMVLICGALFVMSGRSEGFKPDHSNPAQLKAAIVFGALYALVLFVVAAVKANFGDQALYVVAVVSGMTDMDAITLSTARLVENATIESGVGWRVIIVAAMSNLVFKAGAVAMLGSRRLLAYVAASFGLSLAGGAAVLLLWPGG